MNGDTPGFNDVQLTCADCGAEFTHSAADQQRYAERGFQHQPKRCPKCREARRADSAPRQAAPRPKPAPGNFRGGGDRPPRKSFDRSGGGGGGFGRGGGGGGFGGGDRGAGGPPREFFDAVCAECGMQTKVPFKPAEGRPVYCRDCYRAKRPER